MTVEREDFAKFFAAVNGGHVPFGWQERLLDTVLENGRWPDRIAAPTGAGRPPHRRPRLRDRADGHRRRAAAAAPAGHGGRPAGARRRPVPAGSRTGRVLGQALDPAEDAILTPELPRSPDTRRAAAGRAVRARDDAPPLVTARLRGGSVPSRAWRDYPTACAVLCATPDMWGSRLLFAGYGCRDEAKPREAGLLAFDAAVMVDEAHLARQLLVTARRVADSRLSRSSRWKPSRRCRLWNQRHSRPGHGADHGDCRR